MTHGTTDSPGYQDMPHVKDTGCSLAPACLTCPLPQCRYDTDAEPGAYHAERNKRIFELRKQGVPPRELQRMFHLKERQISRIIASGGAPARSSRPYDQPLPGDKPPRLSLEELNTETYRPRDWSAPVYGGHRVSSALQTKGGIR